MSQCYKPVHALPRTSAFLAMISPKVVCPFKAQPAWAFSHPLIEAWVFWRNGKINRNFRMLRTGVTFSSKFSGCSTRERDFLPNLQDAPHGSGNLFQIFRMLRTGARFSSTFSRCSARERDFEPKNNEISRMLRAGARFLPNVGMLRAGARFGSEFSGCSAPERDFQSFQNVPRGSVILLKLFRMLRTGMLLMGA